MNKRDRLMNSKIILFPSLEKRLLEKGIDYLQQKKFHEAVSLLEEAKELDPENNDILFALILSYYESGFLAKSKELAKRMMIEGRGDYIQIVDLYLMILVQLNEYFEIISTIEVLLEDNVVPKEKLEHFSKILHFSRRMVEDMVERPIEDREDKHKSLDLFSIENIQEQLILVGELTNRNLRPFINEIKIYLCSDSGHPFFKTLLINLLKEQEYDLDITVQKFDREISINPIKLKNINEQSQFIHISKLLSDKLEMNDPVLYENIKNLLERHYFLLYPLQFEIVGENAWAAAYHYMVNKYYGLKEELSEFSILYTVDQKDIEKANDFLRKLEEISYLNI